MIEKENNVLLSTIRCYPTFPLINCAKKNLSLLIMIKLNLAITGVKGPMDYIAKERNKTESKEKKESKKKI